MNRWKDGNGIGGWKRVDGWMGGINDGMVKYSTVGKMDI